MIAAILGADIQRRAVRHAAAAEDVLELGIRRVREQDVVAIERKPAAGRGHRPGHRRQRAHAARQSRHRMAAGLAEMPARHRLCVGVADHVTGGQPLAALQRNAGDATVADQDVGDRAVIADRDAVLLGQPRQRLCQPVHAALDQPHPGLLDVRHQHQRRRAELRRGAAIGGVAAIQLAQARVAEAVGQDPGKAPERTDSHQRRHSRARHQRRHRRALGAQEARLQGAEDLPGAEPERLVAACIGRTRETADRVGGTRRVGEQVQPCALVPGMAGQDLRRTQHQAPLETGAGIVEDLIEHVAQGEHGWTDVDPRCAELRLAQLAARSGRRFQQGDRETGTGEVERGHQAADTGSDDDRLLRPHRACTPRSRLTTMSIMSDSLV